MSPTKKANLCVGLTVLLLLSLVAVVVRHSAVSPPQSRTLRVLAGGELGNMGKILAQAKASTGVNVQVTPTTSVNAAQEVASGAAKGRYDAVWFASDAYFDLFPAAAKDLSATTPIMSTPVALAVLSSVARRLGWDRKAPSWAQITQAAESGQFTFGMASPATADAGLSGLIAATLAVVRPKGALQEGQITDAPHSLTDLFHGQRLSAPNSADLIQDYLTELRNPEQQPPDGIIDYEANLIGLKAAAPPKERLTLVYPSDGVTEADYPLSVLTTASPAARTAFQLLVGYLTSPAVQQAIATTTNRRPVYLPHLVSKLPAIPVVLQPPDSPAVVQTLINVYLAHLRSPGRTIYVLDTSASMKGPGLTELEAALRALTQAGAGLAGKFSEFQTGEEITFLPFNYNLKNPEKPTTFIVPDDNPGPKLADIDRYIDQLHAHGQTDIYDALVNAYQILKTQDQKAPGRIDSIVLITDGVDDCKQCRSLSDFLTYYRSLSADGKPAPVYSIAVGTASKNELQQVAQVTGGTFIDARNKPLSALGALVESIRGYQ